MFEQERVDFTQWCHELFTPEMRKATALLNRALDAYLQDLYRRLDLEERLRTGLTAAELARDFGFVESASITLEAMLLRLADRAGLIVVDGDCFRAKGSAPDVTAELDQCRREMEALGEDYLAALDFLRFGAERFEASLRDDPDLMDRMLSGRSPEHADLWFRATNVDPLQDVHGVMGARAIAETFPGGTILEIGGGTGNGIRHLFRLLSDRGQLDRVQRYVFTDISMKFIMETRREIRHDYPDVDTDWRFADINKPLVSQKIPEASADLIYGVNAAHVAKDIVAFLADCHTTLRPGGRVLFAERVRLRPREMAPRELTLNLSVYHRTAAIRTDYRPMHCYLAPEGWHRVFELAGFTSVSIWPDLEALASEFPDQYAAVVIAEK